MDIFLVIALTHFIALVSPGPDFFLLLTTLLGQGRRAAIGVCLGIGLGNALLLLLIYAVMYLLGSLDPVLILLMQYLGAVYLIYLAICCIQAARQPMQLHAEPPIRQQILLPDLKYLLLGLQSSLLNPKNMLFYGSLILLVYGKFAAWQHLLLSIWMVAVVMIWNVLLLKLLSRQTWLDWLKAKLAWIYYLSAACFVIFASAGLLLQI
ncbi:threonine/homoserine/homoserine lactone efflux protein [Acinetobacter calcoaceticus]|uniref:Threonine/homoserine/homoserine lactone efflux protein n=1 Tax=Acinetobacter calcoaceticus TaxID=471 RepID=A0A4V2R099_ACICA|nr:threonine/homoserine/homoserine lactone efflux protein [Acinetobacter calcoaceticus]